MPTIWILSTVGKSLEYKTGGWLKTKQKSESESAGDAGDEKAGVTQEDMGLCLQEYLDNLARDTNAKAPCGELQSLMFKFRRLENECDTDRGEAPRRIHLAFFATPESEPSARAQIDFINTSHRDLKSLFPSLTFDEIDASADADLFTRRIDSESETAFLEGIGTLTKNILMYLGAHPAPSDDVHVNPTGGFKGLWVVWPLIALRYPRVRFLYSQEASSDVFELPDFPLALDFGTFEELHSILKQVDGVSPGLRSVVPKQIGALFGDPVPPHNRCLPNAFGNVISHVYDRRERALRGSGSILLERIESPALQSIIKSHIPDWQNVWLGDQIPETAEHSKGHSLRLMEFAVQAIADYPGIVDVLGNSAGLYLLFASIWLHDIGHTAITYREERKDNRCLEVPIDRFPSLVRDWHAYSSSQLMEHTEYLPSREEGSDLVSLIAKYHRRKMPLRPTGKPEPQLLPSDHGLLTEHLSDLQSEVTQVLASSRGRLDSQLYSLTVEHVVAVEAFLRFLDASDVQVARVTSPEYMHARSGRTRVEITTLAGRLRRLLPRVEDIGINCVSREVLDGIAEWTIELQESPTPGRMMTCASEISKLADKVLAFVPEALDAFDSGCTGDGQNPVLTLEILSLADRILFKTVQDIHFRKHASVACCWYRPGQSGLRVYLKPEREDDDFPGYAADDIYSEVQSLGADLTKVLSFEGVFNALTDTRYAEKVNRGA
jgi:hypothetical protein